MSTKPSKSQNLKKVSSYTLLKETISFITLHELLTVRQVYYGLVSRQVIWNNQHEYQRIVRIVKRARLAGLIRFDKVIEDTREAEKTPSWSSIKQILDAAIWQYRSDWWIDQPCYVEVWLEKRALKRIFYPITNSYDVHLCVGGGYQSWSEVWEARKRFVSRNDQDIIILYFGDLDPSGKDMPRDIQNRFNQIKIPVTVKEIALTKNDITRYKLPKNPKKKDDPRGDWYAQKYGINYGVELDALPPDVLRNKIFNAIKDHIEYPELFVQRQKEDEREKERWSEIVSDFSHNDT